jgi:hypothetical protein
VHKSIVKIGQLNQTSGDCRDHFCQNISKIHHNENVFNLT